MLTLVTLLRRQTVRDAYPTGLPCLRFLSLTALTIPDRARAASLQGLTMFIPLIKRHPWQIDSVFESHWLLKSPESDLLSCKLARLYGLAKTR